jgi:hypothetical protein
MPLKLEIVTAERLVMSEDNIDMVVAPSVDGEVGILPHHAPLLTVNRHRPRHGECAGLLKGTRGNFK